MESVKNYQNRPKLLYVFPILRGKQHKSGYYVLTWIQGEGGGQGGHVPPTWGKKEESMKERKKTETEK